MTDAMEKVWKEYQIECSMEQNCEDFSPFYGTKLNSRNLDGFEKE